MTVTWGPVVGGDQVTATPSIAANVDWDDTPPVITPATAGQTVAHTYTDTGSITAVATAANGDRSEHVYAIS